MIEGKVRRHIEEKNRYDEGYYIVLYKQKLSVIKGESQNGELLQKFPFPNGAEYRFDRLNLYIHYNGELMRLLIIEE
jgi:hypothetical protein